VSGKRLDSRAGRFLVFSILNSFFSNSLNVSSWCLIFQFESFSVHVFRKASVVSYFRVEKPATGNPLKKSSLRRIRTVRVSRTDYD